MAEELHELLSLTQGEFCATLGQFITKIKRYVVQTQPLFDQDPKFHTADDRTTMRHYLTRAEQMIGLASIMKDIVVCKRDEVTWTKRATMNALLVELAEQVTVVEGRLKWLEDYFAKEE